MRCHGEKMEGWVWAKGWFGAGVGEEVVSDVRSQSSKDNPWIRKSRIRPSMELERVAVCQR